MVGFLHKIHFFHIHFGCIGGYGGRQSSPGRNHSIKAQQSEALVQPDTERAQTSVLVKEDLAGSRAET